MTRKNNQHCSFQTHSYRFRFYKVITGIGLSIFFFFITPGSFAQVPDTMVEDISRLRFSKSIYKHCLFVTQAKGKVADAAIPSLPFEPSATTFGPHDNPNKLIEQECFLQFELTNNADTPNVVCFTPGYFCRNLKLFKANPNNIAGTFALLPESSTYDDRYGGAKKIQLQANEEAIIYCRFNFVRTNVNNFSPRLINNDYMLPWLTMTRDRDKLLDIFTYTVSGVLLFMIFYSLAVYLQNGNKEFLFYSCYAFLSTSLLFFKSYLNFSASSFNHFYEEYLDFMILTGSVIAYMVFMRKFINSRRHHQQLDKYLRLASWMLLASCVVFSIVYFFTNGYVLLNIMENYVIKLFFFVNGVVFVAYSLKKKNPLLNYLAAGNFALILFSVLSYIIIVTGWKPVNENSSIFNRALFYYEIGLVIELVFFLSGLSYKNRRDIIERVKERERLKLENERKEFDKQMAVMAAKQEERNRISADMHDELGSGVTAIRLMSEIMKSRLQGNIAPELEKISNNANDLLNKMNTIIWTMKSSNDTLESLIAYIRAHAIEYFDSTPIECTVHMPAVIPQTEVSGEKRRNIFLSIKEALNNAMKHSEATHIKINITTNNRRLVIQIADNGVGIDAEKLRRFGNGLNNMRRRMESIDGSFKIESGNCCVLTFEAPL
jgi:signal transduction histidine kinase